MASGRGGFFGGGLRGSVGGVTLYPTAGGVRARERVTPRDPRTPLQMGARARMDEVAGLWAGLDDGEHAAWVRFAEGTGATSAWAAFLGLTSKWIVLHPGAAWAGAQPPRLPPAGPFYGDNVTVTIFPSLACERAGQGGESEAREEVGSPSPTPSSPGTSHPRKEGALLVLSASQPNAAGVATEVLVQRLPNARRKPKARDWRAAAVVAFAQGGLTAEVALPPGAYAVAYRFVRPASGQATETTAIGAATVGERGPR